MYICIGNGGAHLNFREITRRFAFLSKWIERSCFHARLPVSLYLSAHQEDLGECWRIAREMESTVEAKCAYFNLLQQETAIRQNLICFLIFSFSHTVDRIIFLIIVYDAVCH
jgi:hypothetical protein